MMSTSAFDRTALPFATTAQSRNNPPSRYVLPPSRDRYGTTKWCDCSAYSTGSAFATATARLAAVHSSGPIYVSAKRTHRFCLGEMHLSIGTGRSYTWQKRVESLGSFWKTNPTG